MIHKSTPAPRSASDVSNTPPMLVACQPGSGQMFNRIAKRYDRVNRIISLGRDQSWRQHLTTSLSLSNTVPVRVLDVATGTADVACAIARRYDNAHVIGLDPSSEMLAVGRHKVSKAQLVSRIDLIDGDAQQLPFADHEFDACCIAFGIRNVPDRQLALREMRRVTRPGGVVSILEFGEPEGKVLASLVRWYMHTVVPRLGAWLSSDREYRYLSRSIAAFPATTAFAQQIADAGLSGVQVTPMNFGTVHLYRGECE